jgi:DnaJ-class molecular chaperone
MKDINNNEEICKCCNGIGVQHNSKTGLKVICPCCNGTGKRNKKPEGWKY